MSARIVISDETSSGKVLHELTLELMSPSVSVRDLIELRVREEVARFNAENGTAVFRGLVQPTDAEATLNAYEYRLARRKPIDADEQCRRAWQAFERNGFLMLVGDRQTERLDEKLAVTPDLRVSFVKLVPLVGG
jgi:hypothetical protein